MISNSNSELFIPFGLNFYTTIFFLGPTFIGYKKNCNQIGFGSLLCFISGSLYHSSYNILLKTLDQCIISSSIIYFIYNGATMTLYFYGTLLCFLILVIGYINLSYSDNGILFHSILHVVSNIGIYFLIEGCVESKCPLLNY